MYFLICKFMEAICSDSSVTLLLDDTQWADDASIDLLNQLLRRHQIKFFLIVCSRDCEMGGGDPFLKMLGNLQSFGVGSTVIKLGSIDQDEVKAVMSKALCLLPRQVKTLASIVHKQTKGLILFVMQLILSLEHDGLLHIDLGRKRWVWDQDKIESMRLPENVAICFAQRVNWLSPAVRAVIHLLSMFGHSTRLDTLQCIGASLNMNVIPLLQQAENEGLVNNVGGRVYFSHDRIKRAAYEMISEQNRLANHLVFGQCLIELADQTNDDDVMFLAANQINIAGSRATNTDKHVAFAEYNMRAGKRAMRMSQFSYAYSLFNHGLSFLDQTNHWNDHYDLSLELYELSCRCALVVGDVLGLQALSDQVMTHARNSDDTIKTQIVVMSSMAYASKIADALQMGLAILAQLGEEISTNQTQADHDQEALRTTNLLVTSSLHEIFNYPTMTCFRKVAAMRILAQIQIIALYVNPPLQALIIMKMVNMTISYGLSAPSSIGFAGFASYASKLGNLSLGKSFCKLARATIDRVDGASEFAGETIAIVSEVEC
jgi:predicted ATPase